MLKDKVTILFNTCDSYSDCWYPFFKLWYKFFPDHSCKIILNTESKTFSFDGLDIECYQLFKDKKRPDFGEQMHAYLQKVETPYVITMLDDFFLNSPVDISRIEQCLQWLESDPNAAQFYFTNVVDDTNTLSEKYSGFSKKDQISYYKVNTMGGIWKTEKLKKFSLPHATPWEWECYGTIKSFDEPEDFYALSKDIPAIMNYSIRPPELVKKYNFPQLWGIVRGKWVVESVDKLFKENDIEIDYSIRGVVDEETLKRNVSVNSLSLPLDDMIGETLAKDIRMYERKKRLLSKMHMNYDYDYVQYRRRKYLKSHKSF